MRNFILIISLLAIAFTSFSQDFPIYNQYFNTPYLINPAFVGSSGYSEISATHRRQWLGWEDAPTSTTFNFQHPTRTPVSVGLLFSSESSAFLKRSSVLGTFGYRVALGERHFLNFGLSGGIGNYFLDPSIMEGGNPLDPAVTLGSKYFFDGQFGVAYTLKGLKLGFSLPRLFDSKVFEQAKIRDVRYAQLSYNLVSASYKFNFSYSGLAFEPYVIYRMGNNIEQNLEILGTWYIKDVVWVGGSFRQRYGASLFAGLTVKNLKFGYAYEIPTSAVAQYAKGSHELQLNLRFGRDKSPKPKVKTIVTEVKKPEPKKPEVKKEVKQEPEKKVVPAPVEKKPEPLQAEKQPETKPVEKQPETKQIEKKPEPKVEEKKPIVEVKEEVKPPVRKEAPATEIRIEERKSSNPLELKEGNYLVVGVFKVSKNAEIFKKNLKKTGYMSFVGYSSKTESYYVYLSKHADVEDARAERIEIRELEEFSKAWIMTVE